MTTTYTRRTVFFLALLVVALLATTLTANAGKPVKPSTTDPTLEPSDDWLKDSPTCLQEPGVQSDGATGLTCLDQPQR